jgi:hypothetical protein
MPVCDFVRTVLSGALHAFWWLIAFLLSVALAFLSRFLAGAQIGVSILG